jgi:hypothetical protein
MALAYSLERLAIAIAPLIEKFTRLALWNIEMGPLRQAPGYCGHNLSSPECARGPLTSGRKSG